MTYVTPYTLILNTTKLSHVHVFLCHFNAICVPPKKVDQNLYHKTVCGKITFPKGKSWILSKHPANQPLIYVRKKTISVPLVSGWNETNLGNREIGSSNVNKVAVIIDKKTKADT